MKPIHLLIIRAVGLNTKYESRDRENYSDFSLEELLDLEGMDLRALNKVMKPLIKGGYLTEAKHPLAALRFLSLTNNGIKEFEKDSSAKPIEIPVVSEVHIAKIRHTARTNWLKLFMKDDSIIHRPAGLITEEFLLTEVHRVIFTKHILHEDMLKEKEVEHELNESMQPSKEMADEWLQDYYNPSLLSK